MRKKIIDNENNLKLDKLRNMLKNIDNENSRLFNFFKYLDSHNDLKYTIDDHIFLKLLTDIDLFLVEFTDFRHYMHSKEV